MTPVEMLDTLVGTGITTQDISGSASINVDDLPGECARQSWLYACVCKASGEAKDMVRRMKSSYEITKSTVEAEMRTNPELFGLPTKVSETAINSAIPKESRVVEAKSALIGAERQSDAASTLVSVFDQKRSMLNNEVEMLNSRYMQERSEAFVRNTEDRIAELRANKAQIQDKERAGF